jgi:hypothetical protein
MAERNEWKEIATELKTFTKWTISALIDSAFLILWVFVQWLVNKVVANLELSGIDRWVLSLFQILFAISTLAPVITYIYVDIRIMLLRAQRKIRREKELNLTKGKKND